MPNKDLTMKITTRANPIMKWIGLYILLMISIQYRIACFFLNKMSKYQIGSLPFKNLKVGDNIEFTLKMSNKKSDA